MKEDQDLDVLRKIKEVKVTFSENQANELLDKGWTLLAVAKGQEQSGPHDYMPIFRYSLGKPS